LSKNPLTPIDIAELAKKIKNVLDSAKIRQQLFAKEILGISRSALKEMLYSRKNHPLKQWADCTSEMKRRYFIMHEWSQTPEESIEHLRATSSQDDNDENIDPAVLIKKISAMLKDANISQELFGKEVLGISKAQAQFYYMLYEPPNSWVQLTDSMRQLFVKMQEWIQSPTESILSLKAIRDSKQATEDKEIDTFELIDKVSKLLKKERISIAQLGRMLNIHPKEIRKLIQYPVPWILLTKLKKEYYYKIHEWLLDNEQDEYVQHNFTSEEEGVEEIDTFKVSRDIGQLLKTHGISHTFFTKRKLGISTIYFKELITNTKPWKDLHDSQRKIFKKIEKWTLSDFEEIKALKQENLVFNARQAITKTNSRNKKASN
jgi:hypothetical protein